MIFCEVGSEYKGELQKSGTNNIKAVKDYFKRDALITYKGFTALILLFSTLQLGREDEIYITSTFGADYVSSCVTSAVFNYCKPSKVYTKNTKAILVIHEFGVPHSGLFDLKSKAEKDGIPLIENCAHSVSSRINGRLIGSFGDYAIFSFRKLLLLPNGGLILGRLDNINYKQSIMEQELFNKIEGCLFPELSRIEEYDKKRCENFLRLSIIVREAGYNPYFNISDGIVPYVFPFVVSDINMQNIILNKLSDNAIESGVWRGKDIVILPVHQLLREEYFSLIEDVVKS